MSLQLTLNQMKRLQRGSQKAEATKSFKAGLCTKNLTGEATGNCTS